MTSTDTCLCIICGIPASGKTSLCKLIGELASVQTTQCRSGVLAVHICYDTIIPRSLDLAKDEQGSSAWKEYRKQIVIGMDHICKKLAEKERSLTQVITDLQNDPGPRGEEPPSDDSEGSEVIREVVWRQLLACLTASLAGSGGETNCSQILFLVDDNMFYRSMRYEYFQLARKYSTGFCQVGLTCSAKVALDRNSGRKNEIPENTIVTMATKMELPDASKAPWEKNSFLVDVQDPVDHVVLAPVWMLVQAAFQSAVPPLEVADEEAKERSRAECAASLLHQADQVLRKCISETMLASKGTCSKEEMQIIAHRLNTAKTAILEGVKVGDLVPPSLPDEGETKEDFEVYLSDCLMSEAGL
ncbi:L-seryl-tRNA(Sec) kinase-like [Diadema setosum]|uniref:L-seryl-tRNA(Sec) kinase-like n=1 Tax=Diadema setosum TaxID=31175 RepID=UPI003B3B5903